MHGIIRDTADIGNPYSTQYFLCIITFPTNAVYFIYEGANEYGRKES